MRKILLVTGASRGIGAATARLAAEEGYAVCVNYHNSASNAQALVDDIVRRGGEAIALRADVSDEPQLMRMFAEIDRLGRVSHLVNNAGILERQMRVEEMTVDRLERVLRTNVIGSVLCAREAIRRMSRDRGGAGGVIVNVSSAASRLGSPGEYADYAASKGAIDTMTVGLAQEAGPQGIRVNAVRPAFIYTDIHADGGEPGRVDRVKSNVPLRRGGTADEVARAILWLLSDASSYCSGALVDVAGGR